MEEVDKSTKIEATSFTAATYFLLFAALSALSGLQRVSSFRRRLSARSEHYRGLSMAFPKRNGHYRFDGDLLTLTCREILL